MQGLNDGETASDLSEVFSVDGSGHPQRLSSRSWWQRLDTDGVDDDAIESGAGDGNGDGTPDSGQDNVASLPNAASGSYVTVAAAPGTALTQVRAPRRHRRLNNLQQTQFPIGFVEFTASVANPGDAAAITLYFDPSEPFNAARQVWANRWRSESSLL
ncbi:MAG: hypothetical protein R3C28_14375 [Pirellulaceae bacterium]